MGASANHNQELGFDRTTPVGRISRLLQIFGIGVEQAGDVLRVAEFIERRLRPLRTKIGFAAQSATIRCPGLLIAPPYFRANVSEGAIAEWPLEAMADRLLSSERHWLKTSAPREADAVASEFLARSCSSASNDVDVGRQRALHRGDVRFEVAARVMAHATGIFVRRSPLRRASAIGTSRRRSA